MNKPNTELPRERFMIVGVKALLIQELLAILLKTGSKKHTVLELSENIIKDLETISDLKDMTLNKLMTYEGIGEVKAMEILVALELGRRVYENSEYKKNIKVNSAEKVYLFLREDLRNLKQEVFYVLYLDNKKNLISKKEIFKGTVNKSLVHTREIFMQAYRECASSIVCVHNHPSGDFNPSDADVDVTKKIIDTGNILGIPLLDHIIISSSGYFSFYESGYI